MPARLSAKIFSLLVTFFVAFPAMAADWPQWRGPRRDAISTETGLLKEWPKGGPPLVWKATGLGVGYSSVAVVSEHIYTIGDGPDASFVYALNRKDGKPRWAAKLGKAGELGGYAGPRGTPSVEGDSVFVLGQFGDVVCFDRKDGKELWRRNYLSDFGGELPDWGFAESVLVDGDNVIGTPGGSQGSIVALQKKTGKEVWRCKEFTDPAQYSSPILAEIEGVRQYIQLTANSVVGVAAKDGKLLWRAKREGNVAVIPTPIYNDNRVYVTSGYSVGCNLFQITKGTSGFSAKQVYANKVMVNHHGGVLLVGDYVYGQSDSKGWTCQEFKTGKAVWQEKNKLGKGSVLFADGMLYCRQEDGHGTIALIEANPAGYKEWGRFAQPERSDKNSWAHPVISDGKLYIRDQDVLLCFDVKKK